MRYQLLCGTITRPVRCVIYGPEGIGKSTLAAAAPDPVFIDTEDGTSQLPVARLPKPESWTMLLDEIQAIVEDPCGISTLVVDTLDGAEALCLEHICSHAKPRKTSIEGWGYGKGYTLLAEEYRKLTYQLDKLIAVGVNVICTSHSKLSKFERPEELGAYDRFSMKLTKYVEPMVKEWCDMLLFADYRIYVTTDDNGKHGKASGGDRIIHTAHAPSWDAKNRFGLPDPIRLGFAELMPFFPTTHDVPQAAMIREATTQPTTQPQPVPANVQQEAEEEAAYEQPPRPDYEASDANGDVYPDSLQPIRGLMVDSQVTVKELESLMVKTGYQAPGTEAKDYQQAFVMWVGDNWQAISAAVYDARTPF